MLLTIISLLFWTFIILTSILAFPVAVLIKVLTMFFDKRLIILHRFTSLWASLYTWLNPFWSVHISGKENIQKEGVYVFVCNHQSLADILVLFRLFVHFKWVSKIENFRVPLVGWNMYLNRYIRLVRSSVKSQAKMMKDCQKSLNEGSSVLIFPEGTRTMNGKLRPFKSGAFHLAIRARRPILPIVLNGSSDALPKAGFILRGKHMIDIHLLEPIPPEWFAEMDAKQLTKEVQSIIAAELEKMQTPRQS
ncbi:MAG: lysophospholipid acyltransferase family protein [bacterium]